MPLKDGSEALTAGGDPLKAEEGSQTGGSLRAGASASPRHKPSKASKDGFRLGVGLFLMLQGGRVASSRGGLVVVSCCISGLVALCHKCDGVVR